MIMGVGAAALPSLLNPSPRHSPLSSFPPIRAPLLSKGLNGRRVLPVSATRRRQKDPAGVVEDDDGWKDSADEGEEEEGGESMPFQEMRRWLQNRPKGFGDGKTYDTALEEELMEEIERSREAQLANTSKLSNGDPKNKKQEPQKKEIDAVPNGICVRVSNLPRKKNIHRDLQAAFKGFPGIVNISPVVIGNQKTRDPICKGFAFVGFASGEAAERFVQKYSKQIVIFGKVQKQITCDVINRHHSSSSPVQSSDDTETLAQLKSTGLQDEIPEESETNNHYGDNIAEDDQTVADSTLIVNGIDHDSSRVEKAGTSIDFEISHIDDVENINEGDTGSKESSSSLQKRTKQAASRKKTAKPKSVKPSILSVSRSMARLKVKERSVLTGALSKYGVSTNTAKQS